MITALYLAHLNPVTNAHVEIINELKNNADKVKVMPVVFKSRDKEINSKSFPFSFEIRKKMLTSIFGDSILVTDDYAFFAPFKNTCRHYCHLDPGSCENKYSKEYKVISFHTQGIKQKDTCSNYTD